MKQIIDETRSKRPIYVPDESDIKKLMQQRESLEVEIEKIKATITDLKSEPWQRLVVFAYDRLREIERKRMGICASDTLRHAEIVGQWNEAFRLTQTLKQNEMRLESKTGLLAGMVERIEKLVKLAKGTR